jgi:mitochondrial fission protein ELM1
MTSHLDTRRSGQPRVWVLAGHRAGENAQVMALAEALGWPFTTQRLVYRTLAPYALLRAATLAGIRHGASSPLTPPWPDLVITAGVRNEPVTRWIRDRAAEQGRRVHLIHIGRSWAPVDRFDLIITTPQYRLAGHPKVLQNATTLHRVTPERLKAEAAAWSPRLAHLPRPHIAVMVGGHSGPYSFDEARARRLAEEANRMARASGGSLLVSTSARTPARAKAALAQALSAPAEIFQWRTQVSENPYFAFLALAERIIVTGDSIAMLSEACATRKPVYIFDLEGSHGPRTGWDWDYPRAWLYRQTMRLGPRRLSRDLRIVHQTLIASGHAAWLGEAFPPRRPPPLEDLGRAVRRVHALLGASPAPAPEAVRSNAMAGDI